MHILSEAEYQREASHALRKVFVTDDIYGQPFSASVERRLILSPYRITMEPPLLDVIAEAIALFGEPGFYVSIPTSLPEKDRHQPYHWFFSLDNLESYQIAIGPVANVCYSPNGTWGIFGDYEWFGLFGGKSYFVDYVTKRLPDLEDNVFEFLDDWKHNHERYGADIGWLEASLVHVYGESRGREYFARVA